MTLSLLDGPASERPTRADVTLRTFLATAAAVLLTACGNTPETPEDTAGPVPGPATGTSKHFAGTTEVPVDPQRIVTLQDQNAVLPLLELGVKPVASAGLVGDDGSESSAVPRASTPAASTSSGPTVSPTSKPSPLPAPTSSSATSSVPPTSTTSCPTSPPTVFVQVFERPLTKALADFAEVVGRQERVEELRAPYDARVAALRSALGDDLTTSTVSLLSTGDPGTLYQADSGGQAQYTVMLDLGLVRPAPQRAGDLDAEEYSLEQLSEHDVDAVIISDFGGESADPGVSALVESPLYANLAATKAGKSYVIGRHPLRRLGLGPHGGVPRRSGAHPARPGFDHDVVEEGA